MSLSPFLTSSSPQSCTKVSAGEPIAAAGAEHLLAQRAGVESSLSLVQRMSAQLGDSQLLLHAKVAALTGELAVVSGQRVQELAEKERLAQRLQSLLDLLPGGVIVIDGQGVVREANPAACALLSAPLLDVLWRDVIARDFSPRADDGHEVSLMSGRRVAIATRSLAGEPGQLVLLTDLTETRQLQSELSRHERLSAIGKMVASLAHQIRTPLSAALLYAGHLTERVLPTEQQQRFAGRLKERLYELEHQVRDMLVFARGELPLTDKVSAHTLFDKLREASSSITANRRVRWQQDAGHCLLLCNADTLVGALLNVLENAVQQADTNVRLKVHFFQRTECLRIAISDSGVGMDASTLARLGEPFFTTRKMGTGLGVAVLQAVVRAHHGRVHVRSKPARGSCFVIELPIFRASSPATQGVAL